MNKTEFYYDSCTGGRIRACRWSPECPPVAVVQIIHGIAEHIDRYDAFASFLTDQGILVVAEDHMGHGKSSDPAYPGYFFGGWFAAVRNCVNLHTLTREENPGIPYFLFGHSMGSFLTRSILIRNPNMDITGAIICGTGWQPVPVLKAGKTLCEAVCRFQDERQPNAKLNDFVFGSYNKRIEHPRTPFDWLTRDGKIVDRYLADPLCGFIPSVGLLRDMLGGMEYNEKKANLARMNKELPVLFIAGGDDPVGNYGEGVKRTVNSFSSNGMVKVETKIFPLCRHEILNEINKKEVFEYVFNWISNLL